MSWLQVCGLFISPNLDGLNVRRSAVERRVFESSHDSSSTSVDDIPFPAASSPTLVPE